MNRSRIELGVTIGVAILACAAAAADAPVAVTAVLGIALLVSPGYLLSQLVLGSHIAGLERLAVITGLTLCVPIFGGLLLYAAGVPLHRSAWLGLLAGVTLVCDAIMLLRRRTDPAEPLRTWRVGWRPPRWHAVAFAASLIIAVGAVGLARAGAAMQQYPGFTQLWLLHQSRDAAVIGVANHEGRTMQYELQILRENGDTSDVTAVWTISLPNGKVWDYATRFTGQDTITAELYQLPDLTHLYRHVTINGGTPNS
jgi:uncharacterized membrane protein